MHVGPKMRMRIHKPSTFQTTEEYGPCPESQLAVPIPASLPPDKQLSKRQDGHQYLLLCLTGILCIVSE